MSDFRELVDLAGERLGGSVLYATDDFFAEKENLLRASKPVWKEHEYTDRGKWMDGWESRRKRVPGNDFAIIRLGAPGIVQGVVVDTSYFRGNYPEHCSIDACSARAESDVEALLSPSTEWSEILPKSSLKGDFENLFPVADAFAYTHLRLRIYPDGGVARLRVHGQVVPEWRREGGLLNETDLAAVEHGAQVLSCSDMFFGPKHNLIMPGRARNMSDGWETKRRRGPGHDWVIVQLATESVVRRVEVDTSHFKGNYPDTASIEGSRSQDDWRELLARTRLQADTRHMFTEELAAIGPVTHLRLNVFPDGGVARLRVYGRATDAGIGAAAVRTINTLVEDQAERELSRCCGSESWVRAMLDHRPFDGWEELFSLADKLWWGLEPKDWREAFAAHPRIGERKKDARWAAAEQSGSATASTQTLQALAEANAAYESRFGHTFIVCATGKSADEMLAIVRNRTENPPEEELRNAAEEQRKITRLRLMKLVT